MSLQNIADVSQIIIAGGAILSIVLSTMALRESDRSLAMTSVPSIIVKPNGMTVAKNANMRFIPKEPVDETSFPRLNLRFNFHCENLGRGVALNIKDPHASGAHYNGEPTPYHIAVGPDYYYNFSVSVEKTYQEWVSNRGHVNVEVALQYTNDQQNIKCTSIWKGAVAVFTVQDSKLVYTGEVSSSEALVRYR